MSQHSTTSSQYLFVPIGNGGGESNSQWTTTSRLHKSIASVSCLQKNATVLKRPLIQLVDNVLESINNIVHHGKLKDIATLKLLKCTLELVARIYRKMQRPCLQFRL